MKENKLSSITAASNKSSLFLVSEEFLENLNAKQDKIIEMLEGKIQTGINGYITEKEAKQMLNKKATWFWQMRKSGSLSFKKVGQTNYYSLHAINSLLEK